MKLRAQRAIGLCAPRHCFRQSRNLTDGLVGQLSLSPAPMIHSESVQIRNLVCSSNASITPLSGQAALKLV